MDIFNLKPKFEVPVFEERPHSNKGTTLSEEHRRRISAAGKGRKPSEETRRKISEANKGRKPSEEHRRKNSEGQKGKTVSEETRCKISEANLDRAAKHNKKTVSEWAAELGCHRETVRRHLRNYGNLDKLEKKL